jgi:hypothetical protein
MTPKALVSSIVTLVVAVCAAIVVLAEEEPERAHLLVVGDALLFADDADGAALEDAFRSIGYNIDIGGYDEETIPSAFEHVWPDMAEARNARALVIALGTNDSRTTSGERQVPLRESREALAWWLHQARPIPCVLLVGVNEHAAAWGLDETGAAFNVMLEREAARFANAHVVDWDPTGQELPGTEQIYLGPEGRSLYRETIVGAVDETCRR